MCGRYYVEITDDELEDIYEQVQREIAGQAEQLSFDLDKIEVFPTNIVPVQTGDKEYKAMKWGFTSFDGKPIINARSETALEKPMFEKPMLESRCLIPASGYYEWQKQSVPKQKFSFALPDSNIMYMAGCYRLDKKSGLYTFVILTREAVAAIKHIHDRMPVIISERHKNEWLYGSPDVMNDAVSELVFNKV